MSHRHKDREISSCRDFWKFCLSLSRTSRVQSELLFFGNQKKHGPAEMLKGVALDVYCRTCRKYTKYMFLAKYSAPDGDTYSEEEFRYNWEKKCGEHRQNSCTQLMDTMEFLLLQLTLLLSAHRCRSVVPRAQRTQPDWQKLFSGGFELLKKLKPFRRHYTSRMELFVHFLMTR